MGHNIPNGHRNRLCDHNSESALRDGRQGASFVEFHFGAKIPPGACVLVHRLPYPPVGHVYLFARGSEPPARPQHRIGTLTRLVNGFIRRFPDRRPNSSAGARSQAADAIAYGHRFARTGITFHSVIEIAYKTPIRNRHAEALDAPSLPQAIRRRFRVEKPSFRTLKLRFKPTISSIPRFFGSSDSLDYANRWRSPHAEPPNHSDRKSCSTRREISSQDGRQGAGFAEFRSGAKIPPRSVCTSTPTAVPSGRTRIFISPGPTISPIPRSFGSSDSLDYANRWQSPHAEPPSHSDRKSCSTRCEISSPGRGYGCPNIADIAADAIEYGHRFAQMGITFRSVIGITYKTPIRNRHAEALDVLLSPQPIRCHFGDEKPSFRTPKLSWIWVPEHRRYCHLIRFIPTSSAKELGITFRSCIGIAYVTTIRNWHSETVDRAPVGKWSHSEISGPAPKFLCGSAVAGCRCERIRTLLRSN
ncbi:hypothetical protein Taro_056717, partial [Colocasia esculenta]|nr:hypothetical protein [Colocasia esculenta]